MASLTLKRSSTEDASKQLVGPAASPSAPPKRATTIVGALPEDEEQEEKPIKVEKVKINVIAPPKEEGEAQPVVAQKSDKSTEPLPQAKPERASGTTTVPETASLSWVIENFPAFRAAARDAKIPPLISPEFGGGCRVRLWPFVKEHIRGCVDLPATKWSRDGVASFSVDVEKDNKVIVSRKVDVIIERGSPSSIGHFCLTPERIFAPVRVDWRKLIAYDCLALRITMSYFPHNATAFKLAGGKDIDLRSSVLADIREFCKEDQSQNVEIRTVGHTYWACRFLLAARSKKFRDLVKKGGPTSAITVKDVSPDVLAQLLEFISTDNCQWLEDEEECLLEPVLALFQAADTYQVEGLVKRTASVIQKKTTKDTVIEIWDVVEHSSCQALKDSCIDYMDSIPGSQVVSLLRVSVSSAASTPRAN